MKAVNLTVSEIITEAESAANKAAKEYLERNGEGMMNCGFAWVVVKPARGPLAKYLKETGKADKHWQGGLCVWNPSAVNVQDMSVKYAGAKAYADVLQKYEVNAYADSRLD